MTHEEFIAEIEKMTVLELNDLVKALEEKFGVSAAPLLWLCPALLLALLPLKKKRPSSTPS